MTPADYPNRNLSQMPGSLRRPLTGPLLFGIIFGGIPIGIALVIWGIPDKSVSLYFWLLPVAIIVAALSANLSPNRGLYHTLWRAVCTSFSIWIPIPGIVWTLLAWRMGLELSYPANFPLNMFIFVFFAVTTTIPSWILALVLENLKTR